ncbi:unnamed protein product [Acanthoscelides obtectus]|uniref:Uncharacterized protein n=1 Tax=Acanthoscelides obtectus TaxID=200917 RepID=A0A9P0M2R4_ACAOB|nr:unnamed protein product [Acanthoscelides obtectus]CAK1626276.1 hypothetical protein AOBTE_LOCUS3742 [Acanthoscelides obtectus]
MTLVIHATNSANTLDFNFRKCHKQKDQEGKVAPIPRSGWNGIMKWRKMKVTRNMTQIVNRELTSKV